VKILFLTDSRPYPLVSGGAQRTNLLYRALSEMGTVDMIMMKDRYDPSPDELDVLTQQYGMVLRCAPEGIAGRWPWRVFGFLGRKWPVRLAKLYQGPGAEYATEPRIKSEVDSCIKDGMYDLVVSRYLRPLAMARPSRIVPTIVDVDDFPSEVVTRKVAEMQSAWMQRNYWARIQAGMRSVETELLASVRHAWVVKESDLDLCGDCSASVLPNIPFIQPNEKESASPAPALDSKVILIVGALSYTPNERAVDRFLGESWPIIRKADPDATFRIVGTGLTEEMRTRWLSVPGVELVGFVEDLREEYSRAAFAVCPLWEGGGSSIKVLEAFRYGRTVVCTPFGARGLEHVLLDGESLMVSQNMIGIAEACLELLQNPLRAASLAARGRDLVGKNFTYDAFRSRVHDVVSEMSNQ